MTDEHAEAVERATTTMEGLVGPELTGEQVTLIKELGRAAAEKDFKNQNIEEHERLMKELEGGVSYFCDAYDAEYNARTVAAEELGKGLQSLEDAYMVVLENEESLKLAKARLAYLSEDLIPELMITADTKAGKLPMLGFPVELGDAVHVGITNKNRAEAIDWLARNGHSAMLKYEYSVKFGLKEDERAASFGKMVAALLPTHNMRVVHDNTCADVVGAIKRLMAESFPERKLEVELTVPGPTLHAFVKKNLRNGVPLPEMFGQFHQRYANIVVPKAEKKADFGEGAETL